MLAPMMPRPMNPTCMVVSSSRLAAFLCEYCHRLRAALFQVQRHARGGGHPRHLTAHMPRLAWVPAPCRRRVFDTTGMTLARMASDTLRAPPGLAQSAGAQGLRTTRNAAVAEIRGGGVPDIRCREFRDDGREGVRSDMAGVHGRVRPRQIATRRVAMADGSLKSKDRRARKPARRRRAPSPCWRSPRSPARRTCACAIRCCRRSPASSASRSAPRP